MERYLEVLLRKLAIVPRASSEGRREARERDGTKQVGGRDGHGTADDAHELVDREEREVRLERDREEAWDVRGEGGRRRACSSNLPRRHTRIAARCCLTTSPTPTQPTQPNAR